MMAILRDNGLSITLAALFAVFLVGQSLVGHRVYNQDEQAHGNPPVSYRDYIRSSHFAEATFENWESEFLQMAAYVFLTVFLYQRGSAESKDPDKRDAVDRSPRPGGHRRQVPWPVRRGGLVLRVYEHSLSLAFLLLFLASFLLHALAGASHYNQEQLDHRQSPVSTLAYVLTSRFWFESFQNWQSEFLAIVSMVVLSIFLRQKGSPESKEVASPHGETGKG
jgi:hypothetical protein